MKNQMKKFISLPIVKSLSVFISSFILIKVIGLTSFPDKIYPSLNSFFTKILYWISSKATFSIGDIFYSLIFILGLTFIFSLLRLLFRKEYGKTAKSLSKAIYFLTGFYLFFNLIWGFNYYKVPIKDSYNIEMDSLDELKSIAEKYYQKSVELRQLVEEDENGIFKTRLTQKEIDKEIKNAVKRINSFHPEIIFVNQTEANLKPSLYSEMFSYLGILGYYNPFTGESQYNIKMPDSKLLFTKLHETSHQLGFASEAEANFVGFLIGIESENTDLKYVANFQAMRSILNRILRVDPLYVKDFVENKYSAGMKRDREYEIEVAIKYKHSASDVFSLANEAFLKMNNQEGLESYGRFVELLVGFNRKNLFLE